ncbi:MAG TPA: glycosyltransferase family 39 protein [Bacteroidota bacterium]
MSQSTLQDIQPVPDSKKLLSNETLFLLSFAFLKLALHFYVNLTGGYGYFRDELYYAACAEHLDLGYVDQPPLSIYILAVSRFLFGDSIFALRLLPAIAGAATVFFAGLIARELGGKKFAQGIACIAAVLSPVYLSMSTFYSMNSFDILLWTLCTFVLITLLKTESPTYWLLLGCLLGLGLLNKIGVLWLGFGIFVGLLVTGNRRWLTTRWPWVAGLLAFMLFLPYIIWNIQHDFAHLEFIQNATARKYSGVTRLDFILGQILLQSPAALPLWLAGLWFFFSKEQKVFRLLGWVYVGAAFVLLANGHSKPEYLAPIYATMFAAGAVALEQWIERRNWRWMKPTYSLVLLTGIAITPLGFPILPVETYIKYADTLGFEPPTAEGHELEKLPQFYADMFGWEEKAAAVAKVYHALPDSDKAKCAIFGDNYGRTAAIDYFRKKYDLPQSVGRHNSYWVWGPRDYTGELVLILGGDLEDKQQNFESVEIAGVVTCEYCMPYENNLRIYVCRNMKTPLKDMWNSLKNFI